MPWIIIYGKTQEDIDICDITKFYMSAVNCFSTHFGKKIKLEITFPQFWSHLIRKKLPRPARLSSSHLIVRKCW